MADYPSVPLAQLIEPARNISYGIIQPGSAIVDGVPVIRVSDVRNGQISTTNPLRVRPELEAQYQRTRLRGGELLLTIVGTIGETAIVPQELAGWNVARAIAVLPVRSDVGAYWVQLALKLPIVRSQIDGRLNTTVQATLNLGDVAQLPILLPPWPERIKIQELLSALDGKIELNRRMNETLEAMARAIFKDWFVDFGPTRAKMEGRPPYLAPETWELFPDRLDDEGKPEGWELESIGDVIERLPVRKKFEQKTVNPTGTVPVLDQGKTGIIGYHDEEPGVFASEERPIAVFANHTCHMRLIHFPFSAIQNVLPFIGLNVDTIWAYYATIGKQSFVEYKGHWPDFVIHKICVPDKKQTFEFATLVRPLLKMIWSRDSETQTLAQTRDLLLPRLLSREILLADAYRLVDQAAQQ
jgi:type I restriction enzyme, S subunit